MGSYSLAFIHKLYHLFLIVFVVLSVTLYKTCTLYCVGSCMQLLVGYD